MYWRVVYGPMEKWELRLNESAIVSAYRYSEWLITEERTVYYFCWRFVEPFNLKKAELLYDGKVTKSKLYNHHYNPGDHLRMEWHF